MQVAGLMVDGGHESVLNIPGFHSYLCQIVTIY